MNDITRRLRRVERIVDERADDRRLNEVPAGVLRKFGPDVPLESLPTLEEFGVDFRRTRG